MISIDCLICVFFIGRYSPVRRASEGSRINTQFHGALQECQQLQKFLIQPKNLSPPLADNSVSLPGEFCFF